MNDFAFLRRARVRGDTPCFGARRDQHRTRRTSCFPQQLPHAAHAVAAGGELRAAKVRVAEFRVGRCPLGPNLGPVDVQLFGHEHRHGSHHALAHFELRQHDGDAVVRADLDPDVRFEEAGGRGRVLVVQARKISADNQRATRGGAHLQEGSSAKSRCHGTPP